MILCPFTLFQIQCVGVCTMRHLSGALFELQRCSHILLHPQRAKITNKNCQAYHQTLQIPLNS